MQLQTPTYKLSSSIDKHPFATTQLTFITMDIITVKDFDASLLKFHDAVKSKRNGGKIMGITYNGRKFRLQSEEMTVPFDITSFQDETTKAVSSSIVCSLNGLESNEKMKRFVDALRTIDEKLLTNVAANSVDLMGKEMSLEVLREFFRPMVKEPRDPKYAPLFKVKIAALNPNGDMPRVFNRDRTKASIDAITKGCSVKLIVEIPYAYFVNKNFGISPKMFQACITKTNGRSIDPDAYNFFDDEDEAGGDAHATPSMDFAEDDF